MSNSVRPHRQQPTRLCCPWDSPGKNTGMGCHFLFHCMKVKSESEVAQSCPTLSNSMDCSPPGSSIHGIFQARVLEWGAIAFSFPGGSTVKKKKSAFNARDTGDVVLIRGSGRSPGVAHGNPLQYSCQENPMDRGTWWATVHGVAKGQTRLKQLSTDAHTWSIELVWFR